MENSDSPARARVLRACENCRERKVKCNGRPSGCQQCAHLNLHCVYKASDASSKSRAKAGRGSVLARLKGGRTTEDAGSRSARPVAAAGLTSGPGQGREVFGARSYDHSTVTIRRSLSPGYGPGASFPSSEFPQSFFLALIEPYDEYIYCVSPIITASEIRAAIAKMHHDPYDFMLVHAFGAVTVNLTQPAWTADLAERARFERLVDITMQARGTLSTACLVSSSGGGGGGRGGSGKGPGVKPMLAERFIMATIFLEMCLMAFRRHDEAFLMLREAIALIQVLQIGKTRGEQLHSSSTTLTTTPGTSTAAQGPQSPEHAALVVQQRAAEAKWQRLYWQAFIHERFSAIVEFYPIVLEPLRDSVAVEDETLPVQIREWFRGIVQMFCIIDHEFVRYWLGTSPGVNKGKGGGDGDVNEEERRKQQVVREWIESKTRQLDSLEFMLQPTTAAVAAAPTPSFHPSTTHTTSPQAFPHPQYIYDSIIPRPLHHDAQQQQHHHFPAAVTSPASTVGSINGGSTNLATENWTSLTTMQQADLVITRQWMLTLLWQLALSHCVLTVADPVAQDEAATSTSSSSPAMSLSLPVRLSQQLRAVILQLGRRPIERHGSGIRQKLFEITTTFADVIVVCTTAEDARQGHRQQQQQQQEQRFDDFAFLHQFLRDFAGLDEVQARILGDKAELVRGVQRRA